MREVFTLDVMRDRSSRCSKSTKVGKSMDLRGKIGEELLTVSDVAGALKVPVSWVYERTRLSGADQIPHFKLGKYLRFRWSAIQEWLENSQQQ